MAKEICISSTPHETRLAILEDDQLSEIYYERENEYTLAGSIYKGKVTRVLPGMQSAFVDVGLERDAFLYVTDFLEMEDPEDTEEVERAATTGTPIRQQPVAPAQPTREGGRREERGRNDDRGRSEVRSRRPEPAAAPIEGEVFLSRSGEASDEEAVVPPSVADAIERQEDGDEAGARRWRGRRRRRSGRGREEGGAAEAAPKTPAALPTGAQVLIQSDDFLEAEEIAEETPRLAFEAAEAEEILQEEPAEYIAPVERVESEYRPERAQRSGRGDRGDRGGRGGRGDRGRPV